MDKEKLKGIRESMLSANIDSHYPIKAAICMLIDALLEESKPTATEAMKKKQQIVVEELFKTPKANERIIEVKDLGADILLVITLYGVYFVSY